MSLATLGTKSRVTHRYGVTTVERVARGPRTREEQLSAGRALTRHVILGVLTFGCAVYGVAMAFAFAP
jgi:hypothetical protein